MSKYLLHNFCDGYYSDLDHYLNLRLSGTQKEFIFTCRLGRDGSNFNLSFHHDNEHIFQEWKRERAIRIINEEPCGSEQIIYIREPSTSGYQTWAIYYNPKTRKMDTQGAPISKEELERLLYDKIDYFPERELTFSLVSVD